VSQDTILVIRVGRGGFSGYCAPTQEPGSTCRSTLSGYDTEPGDALAVCQAHAVVPDGAWMVDVRACPDLEHAVFSAPLLELGLEADESQTFGEDKQAAMARMLPGLGGMAQAVAVGNLAGTLNLDRASLSAWLDHWRKAGAKIGRVSAAGIVWEGAT